MRNTYFSHGTQAEKNLYEDLIIEQLKIYGQDTYYLPREEITTSTAWLVSPQFAALGLIIAKACAS